jgi:hypothetical protein
MKQRPFLGVHLRRGDIRFVRPSAYLSIEQIKEQIKHKMVKIVYLATDANLEEIIDLRRRLLNEDGIQLVNYQLDNKDDAHSEAAFSEGELAIIDQIICSQADEFLGTDESTFSFTIQEERELNHRPADSTFNRFCHHLDFKQGKFHDCRSTRWLLKN